MTLDEKTRMMAMRESGCSYTEIADALGIPKNTVKTFFRRNRLSGEGQTPACPGNAVHNDETLCLNCGKPIIQSPGKKSKKFCSDKCRNRWWNTHLDQVNRKALYEYTCPTCGSKFTAYGNAHRKYCSHECYIADRFGGAV